MEVYVKEQLHVLDYNDNIVDTIFISDDKRTAGYAYDINIVEANTGYSDLTFSMPNTIITEEGQVKNPKLALLVPLVKLRYHREVLYTGSNPITVREPVGYGDQKQYIDKTYSNVYPNNIIEDYVMDYIVQPIDKKRNILEISTKFTAMDYPRFNLSKKRVGLTIAQETLTRKEWSLYKNEPMDRPGTIKYVKWNEALSQSVVLPGQTIPLTWDPENATEYPLNKDNITDLMNDVAEWPYGLLATAFYWPIVSTGRFEGTMYKEGGYLVLHVYDFYNLSTEGVDPDRHVDRYAWEWTQLYEVQSLLCPNNARNYLYHILEGTNWSVAKKPDGTDDVEIVQSAIPNPKGSTTQTTLADDTCSINVSGSNCYNAITAVCQGLQLYPIYDCINRTVALRAFAGKNYGLVYSLGNNLSNNTTKSDGEKVITKLYVTGGKNYEGDANINIGYSERTFLKTFNGFYKTIADAPTTDVEGYWCIVDPSFTSNSFKTTKYNRDMTAYTATVHDFLVKNYWVAGPNREVYYRKNNQWVKGTKQSTGNWSVTVNGIEVIVDPITGTQAPWDPNDDMYIFSRSPYGTNYILNFRWAYQNGWITKEQILELYQEELRIHELNYMFMDGYTEDRIQTQREYNEAINNYDIAQDGYQSTLYAMQNKYYLDSDDYSKGTQYCFHKPPQGTYLKYNPELGKQTRYIKLFHCYNPKCPKPTIAIKPNGTNAGASLTVCPSCGGTDVVNNEIYIPTYSDFADKWIIKNGMYPNTPYEGYDYNPHLKGYFLRLVTSLDKANNNWEVSEYEKRVSMIEPIVYKEGTATIDGYNYQLGGVYVRSTSGQIEVWNESIHNYISYYGDMLNYHRTVEACLDRIKELAELYDRWESVQDGYHALIQEKFGDYLIEGNYKNDEQPYDGLLFKEGLEASDKYSIPEITYTLDVIDSSGLIEYRQPNITRFQCNGCGYLDYKPIIKCPKCGDTHYSIINDTYNDLVHMLHNVGQIIPRAGDYVTIYDEPIGMFGVPALITEITRTLDNPVNNKIKLNTSYTDDEELVGNIITATNTVLNNADIYARTSVLKADGTIDSTSIRNTLDNSNADISIVGTKGSILLNGSGLRATDPTDPTRAMKYAGNGVFKTTNLNVEGEATIWEKMMTPSGINATYINSGTIDTNKLTIMSGMSGKVIVDQYGLYVKQSAAKSAHITSFSASSALNNANYSKQWGIDNNVASFIGVDASNNPLVYTKGFLYAEQGSNIANWITSNQGFYHLNGSTKDLWLSPGGINGVVNTNTGNGSQKYALYANGNFGVTTSGQLYAKGAIIDGSGQFSGKIVITDNTSEMNMGTIAGYVASSNGLTASDIITFSPKGISGTVNGHTDNWAIYSKGNFGVTTGGHLYATGANIKGHIYADSGTFNGTIYAKAGNIGGWTINADSLSGSGKISGGSISGSSISGGSLSGTTITGGSISIGNGAFKVTSSGKLTATSADIRGKFSCDGWIIDADKIASTKDGDTYITSDGSIMMGNGSGTHSLNVTSVAANLVSQGSVDISSTGGMVQITANDEVYMNGKSLQIETNEIYVKDTVQGGLVSGVSPGWFKCEDAFGTPELYIVNGMICGYRVS